MVEIRTSGKHSHRRRTIEDAQDALGASSMTKAVLKACDHAATDVSQKREAMRYLRANVEPEHVEAVAEIISTTHVPVDFEPARVPVGVEER